MAKVKSVRNEKNIEVEYLLLTAQDLILSAMNEQEISKSELARRLGVSPANVTQLLSGDRNLTLKTLADIAYVLGLRVSLDLTPIARLAYENAR